MDSETTIDININLNVEELLAVLEKTKKLKDNHQVFKLLSQIAEPKRQLNEALEQVEDAERKIKQAISDKARALYGNDWKDVAGNGYKITRSRSGSVYEIEGDAEVPDEFKKVDIKLDSELVTAYVKDNGKLPDGIVPNPHRTEVIKLSVKPQD